MSKEFFALSYSYVKEGTSQQPLISWNGTVISHFQFVASL